MINLIIKLVELVFFKLKKICDSFKETQYNTDLENDLKQASMPNPDQNINLKKILK